MIVSRISPTARLIADRYQDIFRERAIPYSMLSLLIVMTLCGFPSLSEFVRFCAFSRSVSALSRAIGKSDKELVNRARRRHAWSVLKRVRTSPDDWIWAVDTTSNRKRTKGLEGGGKWANSKDEIFEGQNMMVIAAVNKKTGQATPVAWRPCLKATERKINTNHDLVPLMLKELLEQQWPKLTVVMDSWFDSAELLQVLSQMGLTYVVQLKSSRLAKFHPGPRHSRFKLKELFQGMKKKGALSFTRENAIPEFTPVTKMTFLAKLNLWIPGKGDGKKQMGLNVIAAYNHPKDPEAFGYYATNNLSASSTWCWNMCRCRWNIEVCFRDLRQGLRWGQFAAKTPQGAELAFLLPILIQGILHEKDASTPLLTKLSKLRNSEMLAALEFHVANPKNQQLQRLKSTLGNQAACKKVKITTAEKEQARTNCKKRSSMAA